MRKVPKTPSRMREESLNISSAYPAPVTPTPGRWYCDDRFSLYLLGDPRSLCESDDAFPYGGCGGPSSPLSLCPPTCRTELSAWYDAGSDSMRATTGADDRLPELRFACCGPGTVACGILPSSPTRLRISFVVSSALRSNMDESARID